MAINPNLNFHTLPPLSTHTNTIHYPTSISNINHTFRTRILRAISKDSDISSSDDTKPSKNPKPRTKSVPKTKIIQDSKIEDEKPFPTTIPRKPRRGRRSEAAAVEDFMRDSLEKTFATIREQNSEVLKDKGTVIRENIDEDDENDVVEEDNDDNNNKKKEMVVEEDDPDWPVDAEVGWGIRASEYFEKHPIKNVTGEDGVEIDWEGEMDDNLVNEINCLEWESFAFHPSPLIVLVFERYNRASDNWRALKELEKAAKVYWNTKDRLPPRTVKIDMNIEIDLAYALKVRDCPQVLFLRGNRILYREQKIRTADELVEMIAHFYYKAKKPSWMKDAKMYS